eukprot:scaffold3847_cov175-Prasinococcus_capsulatus_cf.AAC.1
MHRGPSGRRLVPQALGGTCGGGARPPAPAMPRPPLRPRASPSRPRRTDRRYATALGKSPQGRLVYPPRRCGILSRSVGRTTPDARCWVGRLPGVADCPPR